MKTDFDVIIIGGGVVGSAVARELSRYKLAIAVLEEEGMCASLLLHADVLVKSIADGLDLLLKPDRLRATLRS